MVISIKGQNESYMGKMMIDYLKATHPHAEAQCSFTLLARFLRRLRIYFYLRWCTCTPVKLYGAAIENVSSYDLLSAPLASEAFRILWPHPGCCLCTISLSLSAALGVLGSYLWDAKRKKSLAAEEPRRSRAKENRKIRDLPPVLPGLWTF